MPVDNNDLAALNEERERRRREQAQKEEEEKKQMEGENAGMMEEERRPFLRNLFGDEEAPYQQPRQKRARDESFFRAIHINLCPTLRCCTFTVLIVFIDIIMFAISLWLYKMVNTEFLAPNPRALDKLGWKDARKIKKRG